MKKRRLFFWFPVLFFCLSAQAELLKLVDLPSASELPRYVKKEILFEMDLHIEAYRRGDALVTLDDRPSEMRVSLNGMPLSLGKSETFSGTAEYTRRKRGQVGWQIVRRSFSISVKELVAVARAVRSRLPHRDHLIEEEERYREAAAARGLPVETRGKLEEKLANVREKISQSEMTDIKLAINQGVLTYSAGGHEKRVPLVQVFGFAREPYAFSIYSRAERPPFYVRKSVDFVKFGGGVSSVKGKLPYGKNHGVVMGIRPDAHPNIGQYSILVHRFRAAHSRFERLQETAESFPDWPVTAQDAYLEDKIDPRIEVKSARAALEQIDRELKAFFIENTGQLPPFERGPLNSPMSERR